MDIDDLQQHWNKLGEKDPLWAILTRPNKKGGRWTIEEFMQPGVEEIGGGWNTCAVLESLPGLRKLSISAAESDG